MEEKANKYLDAAVSKLHAHNIVDTKFRASNYMYNNIDEVLGLD